MHLPIVGRCLHEINPVSIPNRTSQQFERSCATSAALSATFNAEAVTPENIWRMSRMTVHRRARHQSFTPQHVRLRE
ncbi:hypothetical protein SBBP2_990010 [Burkholderiales bacterium]|nr:hypothetical protein SBBP2_990010 [Burkholderiales bacterium]